MAATSVIIKKHGERAHSKFSASGAERWFNCPGSVELSEGMPDKSSPWAIEGTEAHEVLEATMKIELSGNCGATIEENDHVFKGKPKAMIDYAYQAAKFILDLGEKLIAEVMVETRVYLDFIHPEAFGTFDGAVLDHFGTLHIFDYKYGMSLVSPKENLQMIFYGIGLAHKYQWNFKRVRLWIIQPRVRGYDGPTFWECSIEELRQWAEVFRDRIDNVLNNPYEYVEDTGIGNWCHFCRARSICPLKLKDRNEKAQKIFGSRIKKVF